MTTRTSDGARGVDPNPNRTGGSTGVSPPWSVPSHATRAPVIRCRSSAGQTRREYYAALDLHRITSATVHGLSLIHI